MTRVETHGFRELERALATELPKATAKNALRRGATRAMKRVEEGMSRRAPFDPEDRDEDGQHLRDTMRTQAVTAKRSRGQIKFDRQSSIAVMTGPAPQGKRARANAGWQEYGTVKMGAKQYARPTADAEADNVIDDVREFLTDEIGKAKARIARKAARAGR